VLLASALTLLLPREHLFPLMTWICWAHVVAACLILPARMGIWLFVLAVGLNAFLVVVNSLKVGLTGLPLTMLDLRIAVGNPGGLWDSLNLPKWTLYLTLAGLAFAATLVLLAAAGSLRSWLRSKASRPPASASASRMACVLFIVLAADANLHLMFRHLSGYRGTWEPQGLVAMAADIGVVPFLAYSRHVEGLDTGDFYRPDPGTAPPTDAEIQEAVRRYVDFESNPAAISGVAPNIVVLLAESTFDPNAAFRLTGQAESSLFAAGDRTAAVGPLQVNVIGGGTWVTEFESLVGLDSRLFGYAGYYTHSSLSPYVRRTLATDLKARGYHTLALLPHEGDFYNYRNAYHAYGFDRVVDSRDRGWAAGWRHTDLAIAEDVAKVLGPRPASPFFAYVGLVENHGPHVCDLSSVEQIPLQFSDTQDFEPNCALHEYLRRLKSTEAAVVAIEGYLRKLEARQRRPYVLLVYGDHQPFTFTGTHMVRYDYGPFRTPQAKTTTFFHLKASDSRRLRCCLSNVPATLLPTLLSTFVADTPQDVYLGVSLWLYERCGYDALRQRPLSEITRQARQARDATPGAQDARTAACASAYGQALAAYRQAGLMDQRLQD
jgi:phosphoglycerol transferase MdoB-like AlkP superfamily enzyme